MLETLICAFFTVLPDYLFRRYGQGKRIGKEITFFSLWYELRWGLVACFMATTTLITLLFYYHPSVGSVTSYFRTVTILPEAGGRVSEVYVRNNQDVSAGDPLFRLDASSQQAAVDAAESRISEVDARIKAGEAEVDASRATVDQAQAAYDLVEAEYNRSKELLDRGSPAANPAQVERQSERLAESAAMLEAARASFEAVREGIEIVLPAERDSAEAALLQAQAELDKTLIVAGVDGRLEQFGLQVGDYVSPVLRPAGILVPANSGRLRFQAGFNQIASGVIHVGMIAEMGCAGQPFTIVPMVIVDIQDVIPSGQFRPSDQLQDPQRNQRPGSIIAYMEPLYPGGIDHLRPGSSCVAMAYTDNHEKLQDETLGTFDKIFLHVVDTIGVVHAAGLRLRMILLPVTTLVFSGH